MKKIIGKKSIFLAMLLMMIVVLAPGNKVQAASKLLKWKKSYTMALCKDKSYNWQYLELSNSSKVSGKIQVLSMQSSKPKVVSISKRFSWDGFSCFEITAKKAGTSKITVKFLLDGKTYTYKTKIKVVKYKNPFSSLKIGDTELAAELNTKNACNYQAASGVLNYKLNKGWKVKKIAYYTIRNFKYVQTKTVSNNQKINTDGFMIEFKCYHKGSKKTVTVKVGTEIEIS